VSWSDDGPLFHASDCELERRRTTIPC